MGPGKSAEREISAISALRSGRAKTWTRSPKGRKTPVAWYGRPGKKSIRSDITAVLPDPDGNVVEFSYGQPLGPDAKEFKKP